MMDRIDKLLHNAVVVLYKLDMVSNGKYVHKIANLKHAIHSAMELLEDAVNEARKWLANKRG